MVERRITRTPPQTYRNTKKKKTENYYHCSILILLVCFRRVFRAMIFEWLSKKLFGFVWLSRLLFLREIACILNRIRYNHS